MNKTSPTPDNDLGQLAEDAGNLMDATADVAGEKVSDARRRLAAALERAREVGSLVRDKAVAGAKATGIAVREHPYQAVGVGVGLGILIGYVLSRRCSRNGD